MSWPDFCYGRVHQIQKFVGTSGLNRKKARVLIRVCVGGIEIPEKRTICRICRGKEMLRITVKENGLEQTWILQGRLNRQSIPELVSNWRASRDCPSALHCTVDLKRGHLNRQKRRRSPCDDDPCRGKIRRNRFVHEACFGSVAGPYCKPRVPCLILSVQDPT